MMRQDMWLFIFVGVLAFIIGLLFIFSPGLLRAINERGSRYVSSVDSAAFTHRTGVGLALVIASALFFFVAYYILIKG